IAVLVRRNRQAMPMDRRVPIELVVERDANVLALAQLDERTRTLAVVENHRRRLSRECGGDCGCRDQSRRELCLVRTFVDERPERSQWQPFGEHTRCRRWLGHGAAACIAAAPHEQAADSGSACSEEISTLHEVMLAERFKAMPQIVPPSLAPPQSNTDGPGKKRCDRRSVATDAKPKVLPTSA